MSVETEGKPLTSPIPPTRSPIWWRWDDVRRRHGQLFRRCYALALVHVLLDVDGLSLAANAPQAVLGVGIIQCDIAACLEAPIDIPAVPLVTEVIRKRRLGSGAPPCNRDGIGG